MHRRDHAKEAAASDEDHDGGEHQGFNDGDDADRAGEQAQGREDEDMPDIAAMLDMAEAERSRAENNRGGWTMDGRRHGRPAPHHPEHHAHHKHHGSLPEIPTHAPLSLPSPQQRRQFTWIMETGRGAPVTTPHLHPSSSQLLYQRLAGPGDPVVPLHFQHLLTASSLFWPTMGHAGANVSGPQYYHHHHHHAHLGSVDRSMLPPKRCSNCRATSTPSWRRCPAGKDLLCNACGLYQKLHGRPRPFRIADDGTIRVQRTISHGSNGHGPGINASSFATVEGRICANCATSDTPLWRRLEQRNYCNACALFFKTHRHHRPPMPTITFTKEDGGTPDSFTVGGGEQS